MCPYEIRITKGPSKGESYTINPGTKTTAGGNDKDGHMVFLAVDEDDYGIEVFPNWGDVVIETDYGGSGGLVPFFSDQKITRKSKWPFGQVYSSDVIVRTKDNRHRVELKRINSPVSKSPANK